jgi:hypothetical protein
LWIMMRLGLAHTHLPSPRALILDPTKRRGLAQTGSGGGRAQHSRWGKEGDSSVRRSPAMWSAMERAGEGPSHALTYFNSKLRVSKVAVCCFSWGIFME